MYLDAVSGRFIEQKRKSDAQRDNTKDVVGCERSFGHLISARTVTKLPKTEKKRKITDGLSFLDGFEILLQTIHFNL